jgi:cysteine-rich repeat protein
LDELCNTMRTSILSAAILGLFAGCAGNLTGTGDDTGGDDVQVTCGDGATGAGETCDDGNTNAGDGCSATCQTESATPKVNISVDKPTVMTELKSTSMVTVTLSSAGGFTGDATLTAKAVDGTGATITGWNAVLDKSTITLTDGGTATAVATLTIPSDSRVLTGNLVVDVTSGAGNSQTMTAVTAAKQITLGVQVAGGDCMYPADVTIVSGTAVRFFNPNAVNFVIHSSGGNGVPHQGPGANESPDDPVTEPNTAYTRTTTGTGAVQWYCHDLGPNNQAANPRITVVAP